MKKEEIRKGMLVTKQSDEYPSMGLPVSSVTKVLSQINEFCDESVKAVGRSFLKGKYNLKSIVLCESVPIQGTTVSAIHCNNKPAYYEFIENLRPSTEMEKELYNKFKHMDLSKFDNICEYMEILESIQGYEEEPKPHLK